MVMSGDLTEITQTLVERFHPHRIVLFGSHARGQASPDSDIDLFIEMDAEAPPPVRAIQVSEVFGLRPWSLDVVVYTPQEVRKLRQRRATFLSQIEAEGKVLYERA